MYWKIIRFSEREGKQSYSYRIYDFLLSNELAMITSQPELFPQILIILESC